LVPGVDGYEPDDTYDDAKPIAIGETQMHNLYPEGDVDNVWFGVKEGRLYALGTSDLPLGTDTAITVAVDGDICPETDYYRCVNDDIGPGFLESEVRFVPDVDGTAVATISKGISGYYGADKTYDLNLTLLSVDVDKYEPDEIRPKLINDREPQEHNFYPDGDQDFVKWPVKEDRWYGVFTSNLAPSVDTKLDVTMDDTPLGECDDYDPGSGNFASTVCFQAPSDGVPTVTINNLDQFGPTKTYVITVAEEPFVEVEPESLIFTWFPDCDPPCAYPEPQTLNITVPGGGNLLWSIEDDADWLFVGFAEGKTPSVVTAWADNIIGLPTGLYEGTITITVRPSSACPTHCEESLPRTVPVQLSIRLVEPTPTPTPTPCPDIYEPDDTWQQSKLITTTGGPQTRNFHVTGDVDHVKFVAEQSYTYTIKTLKISTDNDTTLTLYDTDGTSQLVYNDDDLVELGNAPFSRIDWLCSTTGTYFIKVANLALAGGCGEEYRYQLEITRTLASSSSSLPSMALAEPLPRLQMMCERTGIFLPIYWKEWDGLRRFRP